MSDNRPIGIFDSGLGGLTVAKEIFKHLSNESIVYIGDTARVPYGNRSSDTVIQFSKEIVTFLISQKVKAIVVACGTASSVALNSLRKHFPPIPIFGVISAAAQTAAITTKNHQVGIIGTRGTISSGSFARSIKKINPQINIYSQPCPLFVPIIEEGITEGKILNSVIDEYLKDIPSSIDTLVLGCTHYPIITSALQHYLPNTTLINPGTSLAITLKQELSSQKLLSTKSHPKHTFYATDITPNFSRIAKMFLGISITIKHHHLNT